jgi:uncharacterized protein DUF4159
VRVRLTSVLAAAAFLAIGVGAGYAQRIFAGFYGNTPPRFANPNSFQGSFTFCRAMFSSDRREKRGWSTDYPGADINFSIRLSELTRTRVAKQATGTDPEYIVVRLTDPELFQCPYVLMEDAGTIALSEDEIVAFRDYLLKGGFVFVSDTWGEPAREQFEEEISRVLPRTTYPMVELTLDHPLWRSQFKLPRVPQMPSIQAWRRTGGDTDRGVTDPPDPRAIADEHGRLMVVWVHNSDIPDGWEREGEDPQYFYRFSPDAYAVGINVFLYAATH